MAIYEGEHKDEGGRKYWETIRVRAKKPTAFSGGGGEWDLVEIYPSSEEWGAYGWSYRTMILAEEKARELLGAGNSLEKRGALVGRGC